MRLRRAGSPLLAVVITSAMLLAGGAPAQAATDSGYATWTSSGVGGAYAGTVTLPVGFPAATFTSDSRAAVSIATSATQPASSPFGQVFGSSTGQQYIGLRPSGGAGSVSTTTYTFATPTPAGTWGIALGDIDAESLTIAATGADGAAVTAADLGFRSASNAAGSADTLTVTQTGTAFTVRDEECPTVQARCDTSGATAWFQPAVPLSTLTVRSAYVSGAPVYQTWFASLVRAISGTVVVSSDAAPTAPLEVDLLDGRGTVVASTPVESTGSYLFDGVAARGDYSVALSPDSVPEGAVTGDPRAVDTIPGDVTGADLTLTAGVPDPARSVTGTVTDRAGSPIADTAVRVSGRSDAGAVVDESTTTDSAGVFTLENVPDGQYTLQLTPPIATGLAPSTATLRIGPETRILDLVLIPASIAPGPDAPAASPGELAATGTSPSGQVTLALLLSSLGLVVFAAARHRRSILDRSAAGSPSADHGAG